MNTEYEKCLAGEPVIGSEDPKITEIVHLYMAPLLSFIKNFPY